MLLGPLEFGPNNEIIKFVRNAWNDIIKGPGLNNELVKLLNSVGETFHKAVKNVEKDITTGTLGEGNEVVKLRNKIIPKDDNGTVGNVIKDPSCLWKGGC